MTDPLRLRSIAVATTAALAASLWVAPADAWEPTRNVEFVVPAGTGGGADQMSRLLQGVISKNNLMKQPLIVTLKGGASGAEALMYMKSSDGDPNKVLIAYSLIYMLPLSAKLPFDWRELSPVAVIALDQALATQDAVVRARTLTGLDRLRRGGATVLLASHEGSLLELLCDEVWWLDGGRIAAKPSAAFAR